MTRYKGVLTPHEALSLTPDEIRRKREDGWLAPIAGGAVETNINGLWVEVQSGGRGFPASMSSGKLLRWVGGDIQANRADGTEAFSDQTLFGDTVDFVNTLEGNGAPVVQAQSGPLAYLNWLAAGQENVTGGVNAQHTLSSAGTAGNFKLKTATGFVTGNIPFSATSAAVQAALLAATHPNGQTMPAASISCTGGPLPATPIVITFQGVLGKQPVPALIVDNTGLTGGVAAIVGTTTIGTGYAHESEPSDDGGFYSTFVKSVGKTVSVRHKFNDCRIATMRWEGSSASKVVKATPTWLSFDPGQVLAADPVLADDSTAPFIYTEAAGTFTIDGQVYRGHSSFAMESQWALTPWYGDDVVIYDVVSGRATLVLQGITILIDAVGLARYNTQIYNDPDPPTNAKPVHTVPPNGSYSAQFVKKNPYTGGNMEKALFEVPHVKWDPNLNIPASPAGGPAEFPLAGEQRKAPGTGDPAWRITVTTPHDVAYS